MKIGDNVFVGAHAVVEAASVSANVWIGDGAVVGKCAVLKEGCKVLEGTVVPDGMVVPPGCVVAGRPGRVVGEVGVGWEGGDGRGMWKNTGNHNLGAA
jgi:dynactin-5